jgi:hypothetical protein
MAKDIVEDQDILGTGFLRINPDYSYMMTNRQEDVTNKPIQQLKYRERNDLKNKSVYIGGRFIGSSLFEKTNTNGKFPLLSRFPNQHTKNRKADEDVINEISLTATLTPTSWLTGFAQGEYTKIEYPGQDDYQLRKYTLTLGDLSQFPVYATFGRNTVSFGNFTSYSPFTHNHSNHYFWAQTDEPHLEVGYYKNNWNIAVSVIPSQRGLRVVNTPQRDGINNYALSVRKSGTMSQDIAYEFGGGYLHSTIYDNTIAHHPPAFGNADNIRNPAYNGFLTLSLKNIDLNAEYTATSEEWPATDQFVSAFTVQGRYNHKLYEFPSAFTVMYSRGEQGDEGTEWERMSQLVVGYELAINPYISLGFEYLQNKGFVPLIRPKITGDRSVVSDTFMAGLKLTF